MQGKISSDVFELKQIIIETRLEPKSGILYMGNGEMVDVARNMGQANEYPTQERPTKAIVDHSHFQMVDNCKLLANHILSIASFYYWQQAAENMSCQKFRASAYLPLTHLF